MTPTRIPGILRSLFFTLPLLGAPGFGQAIQIEIPSSADLTVTENGGNPASDSSSSASNDELNARHNTSKADRDPPETVDRQEVIVLRFDLSSVDRSTIQNAELQLVNFRSNDNSSRPLRFWGVNDGATGYNAVTATEGAFTDDDWPEDDTDFSTTPGLEFDEDTVTSGVRTDRATDLGVREGAADIKGELTTLATTELKDFLVSHPDDLVTILVVADSGSNSQMRYASKEAVSLDGGTPAGGAGDFAPRLALEIVPVPFFAATPADIYEGDTVRFSWFAPPGFDNLEISPEVGDVSGDTDENGFGFVDWYSPSTTTTYTLSYDFEGTPYSFEQVVTILPPFFEVAPELAIYNVTPLEINWRVKPFVESVVLEVGPDGGPYEEFFVTDDTDAATGIGSYTLTPFEGESHFNLRYTVDSVESVLSADIELIEPIFESVVATNTIGDLETVPRLRDGVLIYQDRSNFTWDAVPDELVDAQFLSPWNDDKNNPDVSIEVTAARDATIYLIVDNRVGNGEAENPTAPTLGAGVMDWAVAAGFVDSGMKIVGDPGLNYSIYFREIAMGEMLTLGAQADGDTRVLYVVAAVAPPVTTRFFAGASTIAEGGSTTLHWLVPPGSTVSIDQGVGSVTSSTDPTTGVGSTEITPTTTGDIPYTLTYDPPGAEPPANLGPLTVSVEPSEPPAAFAISDFSIDPGTGAIRFTWPAPAGVTDPGSLTDTAQRSTLLSEAWENVPGAVITIVDGTVQFEDPSPPAVPALFYRVDRP